MSGSLKAMTLDALARALKVRASLQIDVTSSVNAFDVAQRLGIEVRFHDLASLEGMYRHTPPPHIFVSSLRPFGRQAFTCAHEIGHHNYNHGSTLDDLVEDHIVRGKRSKKEEYLADCFAAFLLMPPTTVDYAFSQRGINLSSCSAADIFRISSWFGVGYGSLIKHLERMTHKISFEKAQQLNRIQPKDLRVAALSGLVGSVQDCQHVVVDEHWRDNPIEVQVGDYILAPLGSSPAGICIEGVGDTLLQSVIRAIKPGTAELSLPAQGNALQVRVRRKNFTGRSIFRYLEEEDDDE